MFFLCVVKPQLETIAGCVSGASLGTAAGYGWGMVLHVPTTIPGKISVLRAPNGRNHTRGTNIVRSDDGVDVAGLDVRCVVSTPTAR